MRNIWNNRLARGFISGISITLLVIVSVAAANHMTSAAGDGDGRVIWRDVDKTAASASQTVTPATSGGSFGPAADPQPAPAVSQTNRYVALGDSVAAGLGLPLVSSGTQDTRCGRSAASYAYEVGRQLGRPTDLYACSGASSGDLFTRQWISNTNPNIQLNQAYSQGAPAIISITAGANDIAWNRLIQSCYVSTCGTTAQNVVVNAQLALLQRNLDTALQQIQDRATKANTAPPVVILTGYYNPVSAQCVNALPDRITANEIAWISGGVAALNQTIKDMTVTYGTFARFAPVDFTGHDLCSATPWIQGLADKAPIHPTADGQRIIAQSVIQAAKR